MTKYETEILKRSYLCFRNALRMNAEDKHYTGGKFTVALLALDFNYQVDILTTKGYSKEEIFEALNKSLEGEMENGSFV